MNPDHPFVEQVLGVVEEIPAGRVMTYGGIAAVLGSRASRQVGQVMARYGSDVPWWRVIRSDGRPPECHEGRALEHYREEGTPLRTADAGYRIDLRVAAWSPHAL
ncbi:MGMT family protein [Microbacterium sp. STN6]|uniref:MGMT family protein n=1 Tax=Microbacterium sp. STN6 TaxID=2995588 RepID=UPI002B20590C|nr:MGMT family protein [Microbacterium sp. STN6]